MPGIEQARKAVIARTVEGGGTAAPAQRRAAFENGGLPDPFRTLIDKVARHAHRVTDGDFAAVHEAGLSEDQIFELVVRAAVGQANRQYESAREALEAATRKN